MEQNPNRTKKCCTYMLISKVLLYKRFNTIKARCVNYEQRIYIQVGTLLVFINIK